MTATRRPGPTAARFVGDDYQVAVAMQWAVLALRPESDIESVELECRDVPLGLDDVVVRRRALADVLVQAKGSLTAASALSTEALLEIGVGRRTSLLQQLFSGWQRLAKAGQPVEIILATTRGLDPGDQLLRKRDHRGHVNVAHVERGSQADRIRALWQGHLGCTTGELAAFLGALRIDTDSSLGRARELLGNYLQLSGFRWDEGAIDEVIAIGRDWIKDGHPALTPQEIAAALAPLHVGSIVPIVQIDAIDPDP